MKITSIDVFSCEGSWRTLNFIKIETDEGITGSGAQFWRGEVPASCLPCADFCVSPDLASDGKALECNALALSRPDFAEGCESTERGSIPAPPLIRRKCNSLILWGLHFLVLRRQPYGLRRKLLGGSVNR